MTTVDSFINEYLNKCIQKKPFMNKLSNFAIRNKTEIINQCYNYINDDSIRISAKNYLNKLIAKKTDSN